MFSRKYSKLLEQSEEERRTYGATSSSGPPIEIETDGRTENTVLSSSAPPVLEPSKDGSRPSKPNIQRALSSSDSPTLTPARTLVTTSCPESLMRASEISLYQSCEGASVRQSLDVETDELPTTCCYSFVYNYTKAAIKLRNSIYIHVFQVLFSLIPISAMVMGIIFSGKCSETYSLPAMCGVNGFIGIVFTGFWVSLSYYIRRGQSSSDILKLFFLLIFVFYALFILINLYFFGTTSLYLDESDPEYCNETFYYYSIWKEVATCGAVILAGIIYLPGSLPNCCCNLFSRASSNSS